MGEPSAVKKAILEVTGIAIENIDLRKHQGAHPRMGAIDVVPFIPLRDYSMQDAVILARETAQAMAEQYDLAGISIRKGSYRSSSREPG